MNRIILSLALVCACLCSCRENRDTSNDICVKVDRIWDTDRYCAFTSIAKFRDCYYICFRDDDGHIWGDDGKAEGMIRVLKSKDGREWQPFALFHEEGQDFRDPDLSVTPDGRLMLLFGQSTYVGRECIARRPNVAFCSDGKAFGEYQAVTLDMDGLTGKDWLWKVSWAGETAYGVVYSMLTDNLGNGGQSKITLVKSSDGQCFEAVTELDVPYKSYPNEAAVHMLSDGRLAMFVRREAEGCNALWGVSEAPFTEWKFSDMGMKAGGPQFIELPDGTIVAASRTYFRPGSNQTLLLKGNADGSFKEHTILPSGGNAGDMSYAGFLIEGDELWVSYYSAHENPHPSIYLARMPLSMF